MLKFAKKTKDVTKQETKLAPWKILITDDEPEVHTITKSVLKKFSFEGRGIEFFSAYSGEEAINIIKNNPDISLVLLDVVMESDDAGLKTAKAIREELNNKDIRIVLRTGQPGSAPEKDVITNYDINDYKDKTELTSMKLYTTVISALRASRDIQTIKRNKEGLHKIIEASKSIFQEKSLKLFIEGVLTQVTSLLHLNSSSKDKTKACFVNYEYDKFTVLATTSKNHDDLLSSDVTDKLYEAMEKERSFFKDDSYLGYYKSENDQTILLYLDGCKNLDETDKNLIEIFSQNISIAFNNICINNEIIDTQAEIIETLGGIVENRSKETANHVNRVAHISYILAKAYGLSEERANRIRFASPMHDLGKVAIPDEILKKPGKLTDEEFEIMKTHAKIGWQILKNSKREILKTASIIAYDHHEKWDGTGYPRGLKGEEISIEGRITALADVFDALTHKRVYKDAWELDKVLKLFKEESGKHFDPKLVELFFENLDEIKKVV